MKKIFIFMCFLSGSLLASPAICSSDALKGEEKALQYYNETVGRVGGRGFSPSNPFVKDVLKKKFSEIINPSDNPFYILPFSRESAVRTVESVIQEVYPWWRKIHHPSENDRFLPATAQILEVLVEVLKEKATGKVIVISDSVFPFFSSSMDNPRSEAVSTSGATSGGASSIGSEARAEVALLPSPTTTFIKIEPLKLFGMSLANTYGSKGRTFWREDTRVDEILERKEMSILYQQALGVQYRSVTDLEDDGTLPENSEPRLASLTPYIVFQQSMLATNKEKAQAFFARREDAVAVVNLWTRERELNLSKDDLPLGIKHLIITTSTPSAREIGNSFLERVNLTSLEFRGLDSITKIKDSFLFEAQLEQVNLNGIEKLEIVGKDFLYNRKSSENTDIYFSNIQNLKTVGFNFLINRIILRPLDSLINIQTILQTNRTWRLSPLLTGLFNEEETQFMKNTSWPWADGTYRRSSDYQLCLMRYCISDGYIPYRPYIPHLYNKLREYGAR